MHFIGIHEFLQSVNEQNRRRTASRGADDMSVLQEEGGQQGVVSFL